MSPSEPRLYEFLAACRSEVLDDSPSRRLDDAALAPERRHDDAGEAQLERLAHEMRNATTAAMLTFEVVARDGAGVAGRSAASLDRSLRRMRVATDHTLAEVRCGARTQKVERVSIVELIDEIELVATIEAMRSNLRLSVDTGPRDVSVDADHQFLAYAVMNLLQNAFKLTRPGSDLSVRARATDDIVLIEVRDRLEVFTMEWHRSGRL